MSSHMVVIVVEGSRRHLLPFTGDGLCVQCFAHDRVRHIHPGWSELD